MGKKEEEHNARISLIRNRLERSIKSGEPVALNIAFDDIETLHKHRMRKNFSNDEQEGKNRTD